MGRKINAAVLFSIALLAFLAGACPARQAPPPAAPPGPQVSELPQNPRPDPAPVAPAPDPGRPPAAPAPAPAPALSPVVAIKAALGPILPAAASAEAPLAVAVDRVRLTGSPVGGPVAGFLRQLVAEVVSSAPGLVLVEEERLDEVIEGITRTMSELYDEGSAPRLGRFQAPRALVEPSYVVLENPPRLRLSLRVRDLETLVARSASCEVPLSALPKGLGLEPSNADRVNLQLARWREEVPGETFRVEVWTDRGAGASYRPGEAVRIFVRSAEAGHLRVELMDSKGEVARVFPNAWHEGDRLEARRVLEIPDETMGFTLEVAGGAGAELIRAVVTNDGGARAQGFCGYTVETK